MTNSKIRNFFETLRSIKEEALLPYSRVPNKRPPPLNKFSKFFQPPPPLNYFKYFSNHPAYSNPPHLFGTREYVLI